VYRRRRGPRRAARAAHTTRAHLARGAGGPSEPHHVSSADAGLGTSRSGEEPGFSEAVDGLGERRLLVGGLVRVDDTLAGGLVELTRGGDEQGAGLFLVAGRGGLTQVADRGTQARLGRLVTEAV